MNFMNNQENIINEVEDECPGQKMSIIFINEISSEKTTIITSIKNAIESLLKKYIQKKGLPHNYLDQNFFYIVEGK